MGAQKRSTPATYQELCVIWNTFIAPNAMTPMSLAMVDSRINKRFSQLSKESTFPNKGGSVSPSKKPKLTKEDYCQPWNSNTTLPPCTNQAVDGGCLGKDGKILKHACNFYNKASKRVCGSEKHGYHFH